MFFTSEGVISMKSSSNELVAGVFKVASLLLSPHASLNLSLDTIVCSYIKMRITSAKKEEIGEIGQDNKINSLCYARLILVSSFQH